MKLVFGASAVLFIGGLALAVANRGADTLEADAAVAKPWDSRRAHRRDPKQEELARLSERGRQMVRSECYESGGDTLGVQNCYGFAREWMLSTADERRERRDLGLLLAFVGAVAAVGTGLLERRKRQALARSIAAEREADGS